MTAMPQMVAIYNGMGGGAAAAIAAVELFGNKVDGVTQLVVTLIGALIGAVSLSGSLIAWAKLDGVIKQPLRIRGQQVLNGLVALATLGVGLYIVLITHGAITSPVATTDLIYLFFGCALVFGVLMTLPIGGADMPVVISIYNAFTGLAVGLEGLVLQNPALMIAGMVVGAAGTLLTLLMAKAMNRSVSNILFTNFGTVVQHKQGEIKGSLKPVEAADAGMDARTGGHHQRQQNLIGSRSIGETDFHGIEMTSHVRSIDVRDGNIEPSSRASNLFCRGHDRLRAAKNLTHGIASGNVPQSAMLKFTCRADNGSVAVTLDHLRISAQRGDEGARHFQTQRLQIIHESRNVFHVRARERIVDNGQRGGAAQRYGRDRTALVEDFLDRHQLFANSNFRHE